MALSGIDEVLVTDATHPTPYPRHFVLHLFSPKTGTLLSALQTFPLTGEFPLGKGGKLLQLCSASKNVLGIFRCVASTAPYDSGNIKV